MRADPSWFCVAAATCGTQSVPPLATAAYTRASCSGVTATSPWPMVKFASSPARYCQPESQFSTASALR